MATLTGGSMNRISQQRARAREWRMLLRPDESAPAQSGRTEPSLRRCPKPEKASP